MNSISEKWNTTSSQGRRGRRRRRRREEKESRGYNKRATDQTSIHPLLQRDAPLSLSISFLSLFLPLSRHRISSNLFLKIAFPRVPRCHVGISPSCLSAYKSHFTRTYVHRIHFRRACAWTRTRKRSEITRTASPQAPSPASQAFPFQVSLLLALLFDSFFQHVRSLI